MKKVSLNHGVTGMLPRDMAAITPKRPVTV